VASGFVFATMLFAGIFLLDRNETLGYWLMALSSLPLIHTLGIGRFPNGK
jgi:hypothetical protein